MKTKRTRTESAPAGDNASPTARGPGKVTARTFRARHLLLPAILFAAVAIAYAALVPAHDQPQVPPPQPRGRLIAMRNEQATPPLLQDRRPIAERLDDADVQRRNATFRAAVRKHDREVAALLDLASKPKERYEWFDSRELAIDVLAHYGTRESIPMYVRNIEYFSPGFTDDFSFLNGYPCALALRSIGLSAQPEVFAFLEATPVDDVSDKAIDLYAHLMLSIYHSNAGGHEEAIEVVRRALERAHRRGNLRRLLDKLEEITKDWPPEPRPAHPTE